MTMLTRTSAGLGDHEVFDELTGDGPGPSLNDAAAAGSRPRELLAATEIIGEMDDREWWRATAALEEHLMRRLQMILRNGRHLLDPDLRLAGTGRAGPTALRGVSGFGRGDRWREIMTTRTSADNSALL